MNRFAVMAIRINAPNGIFRAYHGGINDMIGNALEWTEDHFNDSYRSTRLDGSAYSGGSYTYRVLRGGDWFYYDPKWLRSAYRDFILPLMRNTGTGFGVHRICNFQLGTG